MRTATITFHAPHNYGSMLQAYALQHTLSALGVENEIINLRTAQQRAMYPDPTRSSKFQKLKRTLMGMLIPQFNRMRNAKFINFERFMSEHMILTREYENPAELTNTLRGYDAYITGSDQCWNTECIDFSWAYYLDFVKNGRKISYASSIGPNKTLPHGDRISRLLSTFDAISARESGTASVISSLTGKEIELMPDPTLLVSNDEWSKLAGAAPIIDGKYILLYSPYVRDNVSAIAKSIAKSTGWSIVVTKFMGFKEYRGLAGCKVRYQLDAGPIEFLNLIKNASVVVSGSFHALVFSMIFSTPFFAVDGDKDNRMKHILASYNLSDRTIHIDDVNDKLKSIGNVDFSTFNSCKDADIANARNYLTKSLGLRNV